MNKKTAPEAVDKPRQSPDWERIEYDYRAGLLSVREIASQHSITHTAINKRAKKDGWERDLKAKIKAKADALVSKREVSKEVSSKQAETEREIIESNAEAIANVRMAHRGDISRSRRLTNKLLEELELLTDNRELYEELGELLRDPDDNGMDKLNDLYQKVVSLPTRTKTMKELAETLKTLVSLERQAYDLDSKLGGSDADELSKLMDELSQEA
jgi:DNA-directed RNA polymerase subunit F